MLPPDIRLAIVSSNSETSIRRTLGPETAALIERFECSASLFGKAQKLRRGRWAAVGAAMWGYASREALMNFPPNWILKGSTPSEGS